MIVSVAGCGVGDCVEPISSNCSIDNCKEKKKAEDVGNVAKGLRRIKESLDLFGHPRGVFELTFLKSFKSLFKSFKEIIINHYSHLSSAASRTSGLSSSVYWREWGSSCLR